jgi:hypothetical protein
MHQADVVVTLPCNKREGASNAGPLPLGDFACELVGRIESRPTMSSSSAAAQPRPKP